ncbi:DUF1622 domain-containing protein [Kaistella polysaccharea]|uniref:DUF1622 domain-containing protein n=1 Tax=Kaistella polysaccharea TaxID=2878534 RepID=UPI001CF4F04C|nr:DUF1622 domain-containing protein [Kaistella polysaccharea]
MEEIRNYIEYSARALEILGIITIVFGTLNAIGQFLFNAQSVSPRSYKILRQELGKAILLGLEILVAGDIIATVVTDPTLERVVILAIIVLIRTFLSLSIQVEIEGKFPWQKRTSREDSNSAA